LSHQREDLPVKWRFVLIAATLVVSSCDLGSTAPPVTTFSGTYAYKAFGAQTCVEVQNGPTTTCTCDTPYRYEGTLQLAQSGRALQGILRVTPCRDGVVPPCSAEEVVTLREGLFTLDADTLQLHFGSQTADWIHRGQWDPTGIRGHHHRNDGASGGDCGDDDGFFEALLP
jgi:hypothetical protein